MDKLTRRFMLIRTTGLAAGAAAMLRGAMRIPLSGMAWETAARKMNALSEVAGEVSAGLQLRQQRAFPTGHWVRFCATMARTILAPRRRAFSPVR